MGFLAGETLTAGKLNRIQPAVYLEAATSALTMTTTTETDVPGASITLTTLADGATYTAIGIFDAEALATSTTILMIGKLMVDGVVDSGTAVYAMDTLDRATVAMVWQGVLSTAGSHTLKLRGNLSSALATGGRFLQDDTKLQVTITEAL